MFWITRSYKFRAYTSIFVLFLVPISTLEPPMSMCWHSEINLKWIMKVTFLILSLSFLALQFVDYTFGYATSSPVKRIRDGVYSCPLSPITEKYPDPESRYCEYFFLCHRGHAFPRKCPPLHAFHPLKVECVKRDQIPEDVCPYEMRCGFNGYLADRRGKICYSPNEICWRSNCSRLTYNCWLRYSWYYLCFYRTPTHYSCTEGKVFNPTTSTCVMDKAKAKACSKPTMAPHFVTASTTKRSIRSISNSMHINKHSNLEPEKNSSKLDGDQSSERFNLNSSKETIITADPLEPPKYF